MSRTLQTAVYRVSRQTRNICLTVSVLFGLTIILGGGERAGAAGGGDLDTTFNAGGSGADSQVSALVLQPDGKILIAGFLESYNGDAAANDDTARLGGNLFVTWPAGDATDKTVVFPIINGAIYEGNETLNPAVSILAGGASLGSPSTTALTIVDNETKPKLSVNNVSVTEANIGTTGAAFTVKLSGASS